MGITLFLHYLGTCITNLYQKEISLAQLYIALGMYFTADFLDKDPMAISGYVLCVLINKRWIYFSW